jgi:hypothetical protein
MRLWQTLGLAKIEPTQTINAKNVPQYSRQQHFAHRRTGKLSLNRRTRQTASSDSLGRASVGLEVIQVSQHRIQMASKGQLIRA